MPEHLLTRRVRASLGYDMTLTDWMCHAWYLVTDRRYRASVRALKIACEPPALQPDRDVEIATKNLRKLER